MALSKRKTKLDPSFSTRMSMDIVMLEHMVLMSSKMLLNMALKNSIDVSGNCHNIASIVKSN
jgi:hypothetical protein